MAFYNESSRWLQSKFDSFRLADQLERTRRHDLLTLEDQAIIRSTEYFFIATADKYGRPDCSVKGGNPGFVTCMDERTLSFPNYDGNGMFRSLGNVLSNRWVGLLFVEFGPEPRKLRINGRARFSHEGIDQPSDIVVIVDIEDIFPNCPRYLPSIQPTSRSVFNPAPGYTPPEPLWKSKPDLKPYLPGGASKDEED